MSRRRSENTSWLILTDAQYPQTLVVFLGARRSTDLDMANGARGHTVDIVLDEREEALAGRTHCRRLQYPSLCARVNESDEGQCTRWAGTRLEPLIRTFSVASANGKRISISRQQLPVTCICLHRLSCPGSDGSNIAWPTQTHHQVDH